MLADWIKLIDIYIVVLCSTGEERITSVYWPPNYQTLFLTFKKGSILFKPVFLGACLAFLVCIYRPISTLLIKKVKLRNTFNNTYLNLDNHGSKVQKMPSLMYSSIPSLDNNDARKDCLVELCIKFLLLRLSHKDLILSHLIFTFHQVHLFQKVPDICLRAMEKMQRLQFICKWLYTHTHIYIYIYIHTLIPQFYGPPINRYWKQRTKSAAADSLSLQVFTVFTV